ncbi:MAG: hypothetical protein EON95_16325 [Caulobacteraceae bacterium]|nr:MAG: hypothetical protein EON95_16325 [Caulobacteraceae bacterium]
MSAVPPEPDTVNLWVELTKGAVSVSVAVLAAFLALLANRFLDRDRASREYRTKISDQLRDDTRRAIEAAAEYWSKAPETNKSVLESRIRMYEQDIRAAKKVLDENCSSADKDELQESMDAFLSALMGADFEGAKVKPNSHHVVMVASLGATFRKTLARARRRQIKKGT